MNILYESRIGNEMSRRVFLRGYSLYPSSSPPLFFFPISHIHESFFLFFFFFT